MEISTLINLSINDYAFYWSLPELIGIENGFYEDENLKIKVNNVTPVGKVKSKSQMYIDLQKKNLSDFYHAAEDLALRSATLFLSPCDESASLVVPTCAWVQDCWFYYYF